MYKTISKFMSGIRKGLGNSLKHDKEKQDWINGIETIRIEPYKASTKSKKKKPVAKRSIENSLHQDPMKLEDKLQTSQKKNPAKTNEKQPMTEIENRKHFNAILVSLKTVSDILRNIDQLCASPHSNMHMLRNSIRLKAPEIHQAFTNYISIFKLEKVGTKTAIIPFAEWAISIKLIPIKVIEAAKNGKDIKPFSELSVARKALIEDIKKGKLPNTNVA